MVILMYCKNFLFNHLREDASYLAQTKKKEKQPNWVVKLIWSNWARERSLLFLVTTTRNCVNLKIEIGFSAKVINQPQYPKDERIFGESTYNWSQVLEKICKIPTEKE